MCTNAERDDLGNPPITLENAGDPKHYRVFRLKVERPLGFAPTPTETIYWSVRCGWTTNPDDATEYFSRAAIDDALELWTPEWPSKAGLVEVESWCEVTQELEANRPADDVVFHCDVCGRAGGIRDFTMGLCIACIG